MSQVLIERKTVCAGMHLTEIPNPDVLPRRPPGGGYRVVLASDWYLPRLGGIELQVAGLAQALATAGHHPVIHTTTPGQDSKDGIEIVRISSRRLPGSDLAISPDLVARLVNELVAAKPDVVHAHLSVVSPTAVASRLAARRLELPTVVTVHSMVLFSQKLWRLADKLAGWSRWPLVLTGVSQLVARQMAAAAAGAPVGVLPNGIDGDLWRGARATASQDGRDITIVSAMRLVEKKRPVALLTAFGLAAAAADREGRRLSLRIAGEGPERRRLMAMIARENLAERVTLLGPLPRPALARLYRDAHIFAMPSTREAFGIAALEARAAGLAVVAMAETGGTDFIAHERTGLLAANDADFAGHLGRLALDDALRNRLASPDPSLSRYHWPAVVDAHVAAYEAAIRRLTCYRSSGAKRGP